MIEISAGIIVYKKEDDNIKFFVCTPGGPLWGNKECWGFPKGHLEEGETPFEGALREFFEETGTMLSTDTLKYTYLGLIKQRSNKKVHIFVKKFEGEKLDEECFSNTFTWTDGNDYPEIGKYAWMTFDEIQKRGGVKAYYDIFKHIEEENG